MVLKNMKILSRYILIFSLFLIGFFVSAEQGSAVLDYPKLANYYLSSDQSFDYDSLAKYDLVILPIDTQLYNEAFFNYARSKNPDIKILAYTPAQSVNTSALGDTRSFNYQLKQQIKSSWWLKDPSGNTISTWPGIKNINVSSDWSDWFPGYVKSKVLDTGLWDGIFYDMVDPGIAWANNGNIDINNDRKKDTAGYIDNQWKLGFEKLLKNSRQTFGSKYILVINGASEIKYQSNVNGRMFEDFPTPWQGSGRWQDSMNALKTNQNQVGYSQMFVLNGLGNQNDYQNMRFGLTSSLIGDAYFGYDNSIAKHEAIWWYDEYNINLGQPVGDSKNLFGSDNKYIPSVWQRDFSNGVALVNSTNQTKTIDLGSNGVYEKIRGTQDLNVNNGRLVKKVTLQPEDGIILLRKLEGEEITDVVFTNGDFVRVFDKRGNSKRAGFYAYDPNFPGGVQIINIDIDKDGVKEKIVAGKSDIQIFKNDVLIKKFYPYGESYTRGINIAVGNVQDDSKLEIVTGTQNGASPNVKIFNYNGETLHKGWMAYHPNFRGGVQVALGDLNGNGYKEIVTGAGFGGGPHVMIFDYTGHLFDPGFFPYNKNFRGGVNVTCMDLNYDGKDEIITGAGRTGGPHIMIYDKIGHLVDPGFFAFDSSSRNGVKVAAVDIDNDGQVEILGMQ